MSLVPKSSLPEKMQLLFTPSTPASEPIYVSNDSFALFMLPVGTLRKIGRFASVEAMRNLIATCKHIKNQLNTWFLQVLASEYNPDRATSRFIIDAIGNNGNTCLWCNAEFLIKDHAIPKDLSIHLFTNTTAKKISSDEVRSMIIQFSGSPGSYVADVPKFLRFLFLKVSFKNLKCLMFCGIELSKEFYQEMGALNLDVFHMRNFRYKTGETVFEYFNNWNSLKTLYVVHPNENMVIFPPDELKKLVIYCPKSSKDFIRRRRNIDGGLDIVDRCRALKEM